MRSACRLMVWKTERNLASGDAKHYRIVSPGLVSPPLPVPQHIAKPDYVSGVLQPRARFIDRKTDDAIERMRDAGRLAKQALAAIHDYIEPGITTNEIDQVIHSEIVKNGAYPSPLHYKGFPKSCCTSVNNVACHGVPDDSRLAAGDIINVDVAVFYRGYHCDTSDTFAVGHVDAAAARLIEIAREGLHRSIDACKPGVSFQIIGQIIESLTEKAGFAVNRKYIGHGIGSYFHGPPSVYPFANKLAVDRAMLPGMTFTIEPIIMEHSREVDLLSDGWTVISRDGGRSAQAEHTVLITPNGCEVLT